MIVDYRPTGGYAFVPSAHFPGYAETFAGVPVTGPAPTVESIQELIHAYLVDKAAVTTEVGYRIFWVEAPQRTTLPYVTYYLTTDPHLPFSFGRIATGQAQVTVNTYDDNKYEALRIAHIVRDSIHKYQGTKDAMYLGGVFCGRPRSFKLPGQNVYGASFSFLVYYDDV